MGEKQMLAVRVLFFNRRRRAGVSGAREIRRWSSAGCVSNCRSRIVYPQTLAALKRKQKTAVERGGGALPAKAPPAPGDFGSGKCTCLHREGSWGLPGGAEGTRHLLLPTGML